MAEFLNAAEQTVTANGNIIYTSSIGGGKCIKHRTNSGIVTLRGITNGQSNARFLVMFNGNIAIPTGGAVGEISVAIAIAGEALATSVARVVPAAVNNYNNVSVMAYIDVPAGCCTTIAVENTSGFEILAESSNLIVTRVA